MHDLIVAPVPMYMCTPGNHMLLFMAEISEVFEKMSEVIYPGILLIVVSLLYVL